MMCKIISIPRSSDLYRRETLVSSIISILFSVLSLVVKTTTGIMDHGQTLLTSCIGLALSSIYLVITQVISQTLWSSWHYALTLIDLIPYLKFRSISTTFTKHCSTKRQVVHFWSQHYVPCILGNKPQQTLILNNVLQWQMAMFVWRPDVGRVMKIGHSNQY